MLAPGLLLITTMTICSFFRVAFITGTFLTLAAPNLAAQNYRPWFRENSLKEKMQVTLEQTIKHLENDPKQFPSRARDMGPILNRMLLSLEYADISLSDKNYQRDQNYCRSAYAFHGGANQIVVCPSGERFREEFLVQILIHELAHVAGVIGECDATEIAVVSSNFGQEIFAYANGYLYKVSSWLKYKTLDGDKLGYRFDKHHCREVVKTYKFVNL